MDGLTGIFDGIFIGFSWDFHPKMVENHHSYQENYDRKGYSWDFTNQKWDLP